MKKILALTLMILLVISMVACGNNDQNNGGNTAEPESLKLGLGVLADASSSKLEVTINYAAVLLDKDGKIVDCEIDTVVASAKSTDGVLALPEEVLTKGEQGDAYGMKAYSGIGKEWYEQAQALADYCVGKTKAEITGIAIGEGGKATDDTVKSFATMDISDLVKVVAKACDNAKDLGTKTGDTLKVASTSAAKGTDATEEADGSFTVSTDICALTVDKDGKVTASVIDAVEPKIAFDKDGTTFTPSSDLRTKGEKGDEYGMKAYSGIGKEWYEQIEGFCAYLKGKTASEISGIAMGDDGKTTDTDLLATATMAVSHFKALVEKTLK